ncbi:hypothetical protein BGZ61DRAFT_542404 [Ilyonectria robusta]|uniref:uncharacterized protein n=1 Tax=Ilyonectria robusta TaxID=1079257 RepID=UPI001E8E885C|nr:uncharacterized protein BGZ61DRAFT_542404 [Ilyonectria robusta]KAH8648808.1 hypothetical protein BGZ61DRAFT_542404 [Ilyonectria robusta]
MGDNNSTGLNGSLLDQVSPLFIATNFNNYAEFAITAHGGSEPNSWLSLEMIHNYIHNLVGGVGWPLDPSQATGSGEAQCSHGHMVDLGTAAFDPISGCITATLIDNLYPCHTDSKFTNYASDMVQDWTTLEYTYPNLAPETDSNAGTASPELIKKRLTGKYRIIRKVLTKVGSEQNIEGLDNNYVINISYNRFALNGSSYTIHFFFGKEGDIPNSPTDHKLSPDHVGSIHTFSANYWTRGNKNGIKCGNCQKQQKTHQLSKGQVSVTLQLKDETRGC